MTRHGPTVLVADESGLPLISIGAEEADVSDVAELRALLEKAGPLPWVFVPNQEGAPEYDGDIHAANGLYVAHDHEGLRGAVESADAALIVAAVNALPDLLARLESADSLDVAVLADALHAKVCGPFATIDPKDCIHGRGRDELLAKAIATEYAALREDVR